MKLNLRGIATATAHARQQGSMRKRVALAAVAMLVASGSATGTAVAAEAPSGITAASAVTVIQPIKLSTPPGPESFDNCLHTQACVWQSTNGTGQMWVVPSAGTFVLANVDMNNKISALWNRSGGTMDLYDVYSGGRCSSSVGHYTPRPGSPERTAPRSQRGAVSGPAVGHRSHLAGARARRHSTEGMCAGRCRINRPAERARCWTARGERSNSSWSRSTLKYHAYVAPSVRIGQPIGLWPALWHSLSHRPDVPRQLRCELLITLHAGDRVLSLLDVLPDDFTPLARVTSREEGMQVRRLLDRAPSVREWLLRESEGSDRL